VTFRSQRADQNAEFVASTDIWFRPVNFLNAPDGTLHVIDMYRETIEHPWSIPDDIKAKLNLTSGNDRGRLYRLAPPGFKLAALSNLGDATIQELVATLEHANAWHRETAQRLLYERQDQASVEPLQRLLWTSKSAVGRLHALYSLAGQQGLRREDLLHAIKDAEAQIRRHAVQLAEPMLDKDETLQHYLYDLIDDESPVVRFQVALSLGEVKHEHAGEALAEIAMAEGNDEWIRAAILSSAGSQPLAILKALLANARNREKEGLTQLVRELAFYATASDKTQPPTGVLDLIKQHAGVSESVQFALLSGRGLGLERRKRSVTDAVLSTDEPVLQRIRDKARQIALDTTAPSERRLAAMELFRFAEEGKATEALSQCLDAREPVPIQLAAIQTLKLRSTNEVGALLKTRWQL
jgi:hypothetical protein